MTVSDYEGKGNLSPLGERPMAEDDENVHAITHEGPENEGIASGLEQITQVHESKQTATGFVPVRNADGS